MKNLTIKITGGGSPVAISKALDVISHAILTTPVEELDGSEWEDRILMTEINADEMIACDHCYEKIPESDLYCNNCGNENF